MSPISKIIHSDGSQVDITVAIKIMFSLTHRSGDMKKITKKLLQENGL